MKAKTNTINNLPQERIDELFNILKSRFEKNMNRHKEMQWDAVQNRLESNSENLWSLNEMEETGGEPDVVDFDKETGEYVFFDCAAESPKERRGVCYDQEALDSRKKFKPAHSAVGMAEEMGAELLTEEQYHRLHELGEFDKKTSSWLFTPPAIRKLGGAIFGDLRFGRVFIYHNGAESYYGGRGFRCSLKV
ncbi:DUF4256 domain-containing protein [Aequorivita capsosiphonis]|uniref:DUF4256 domain-containing protein n=1 Tax=Aequorivita capsosiphonis TaxID=487317 RepID=UPI00040C87B1|nr:DUF4256 domain-containing protein [Aequorivita capsosiphonis]